MLYCPHCKEELTVANLESGFIIIKKIICEHCNKKMDIQYGVDGIANHIRKYSTLSRDFLEELGVDCPYCERKVLTTHKNKLQIGGFKEEYDCPWCTSKLEVNYEICSGLIKIWVKGLGKKEKDKEEEKKDNYFHCTHIGIAETTDIVFKKINEGWVCRMGIAIMGSVNFPEMIGASPWDTNFHDNYVEGEGKTKEEAIEMMKKEIGSIQKGLWA